jgi:glycosyltransferase involved in cell wall biosynthesis
VIAILVPVLGRAHQIEPLLASIAAATEEEYRVVFICSPDDPTREVCLKSDADTVTVPWGPNRADFAKKINRAYATVEEEEWYFQAATDLVFHPGWAERALHVAQSSRCGVIGTNDLGNPMVKRGNHSTHILFSRAYIEKFGGTFDGSGAIFSEVYDHQFVDTEFVQTALFRKQFKSSLRSHVEHMHPHWGKGEMDATYEKSERSFREDARIFNERMRRMRRGLGSKPYQNRRIIR